MSKANAESVGMNAARLERIAPVMRAYVDRGVYAGIRTLVARRGVVVHDGVYGQRDREADLPMTQDTIFRWYSMTKPIVSTALMTLYEEGRFRLIDPVAAYIPSFAAVQVLGADGSLRRPLRPVTVLDLLTHTSGLSYNFLGETPVGPLYRGRKLDDPASTLAEAIDDIAALPLAFEPGARWHYSIGIDVAARVAEVVSGRRLGDLLAERLFEPLGMADAGFAVPEAKQRRLAAMYGRDDLFGSDKTFVQLLGDWMRGVNDRVDVSATYPVDRPDTFQRGGHGLFGTVDDYFRFAQMLCNGGVFEGRRIIGRKTLELMHTNHLPLSMLPLTLDGIPMEPGYGFGLGSRVAVDPTGFCKPGSVGDFGWAGAAKTYFWVDPVERIVALFMTQSLSSFDLPEQDLAAIAYGAIDD
jgi:CubicO group peptidase (beta-lactamase class C family)